PQRTVLFLCYAGEEQGLFGASAHAQSLLSSGDASRVEFMLNMDMIGYSADSDLDVLIESTTLGEPAFARFGALAAAYAPSLRLVTSLSPCCSDHMPYLNAGIPAALTIENDWNVYAHYHRSTDVPANISNALAMGGGILKMNAAFLADTALASDRVFADGVE
ncbi:MAG: M28 family peptidase, partial [Lysobacterales bacterium]